MKIDALGLNSIPGLDIAKSNKQNAVNTTFDDIFKKVVEGFNATNVLQKDAEKATLDLALGKTDNIHSVMIAQEKASVALQFTLEVRNKVLDAYNQIMRMPM